LKSFRVARTPIICVDKDQSLSYALDVMDSNHLSALPVVDGGKFLGIITVRGIMGRIWSERVRTINLSSLYVSSVMETNIPKLSMDSTLIEACKLMIKHDLIALPILDYDKPIGMIFEDDIPILFSNLNIDSKDFINRDFRIVSIDSSILNVRSSMLKYNLRFIPVVKSGIFLGMVYDWDVIMALKLIHDRFPSQHRDARVRSLKASDVMRFKKASFYGYPPISLIAKVIIDNKSLGAVALNENGSINGVVDLKVFVKMVCDGVLIESS